MGSGISLVDCRVALILTDAHVLSQAEFLKEGVLTVHPPLCLCGLPCVNFKLTYFQWSWCCVRPGTAQQDAGSLFSGTMAW